MTSGRPITSTERTTEEQIERGLTIAFVVLIVMGIVFLGIAVALAVFASGVALTVEVLRDYLIIAMTLQLIVIGVAIVVFLVQLARFINLMNNEIKPMLETTTETLNMVRGTATFMSKYLAEPVVKANAQAAGVMKVINDVDAIRKSVSKNEKSD